MDDTAYPDNLPDLTPHNLDAVLWNSAHDRVLAAIIQETGEGVVGHLYLEPGNPVDTDAIAMALNPAEYPRHIVGGDKCDTANGEMLRIGYLRRTEPRRGNVAAVLRELDRPLRCRLICDERGREFRVVVIEGSRDDIPY